MGPSAGSYRPPLTAVRMLSKIMGASTCFTLILRTCDEEQGARGTGGGGTERWAAWLAAAGGSGKFQQRPPTPNHQYPLLRFQTGLPGAPCSHLFVIEEAEGHGGHLGRRYFLRVQAGLHLDKL